MTKYTERVEQIFKTVPAPYPAFVVDLVEYPGHMGLRVYSQNIAQFNQAEKVQLATYLYEVRDAIRAVVGCEIEGVDGHAPGHEPIKAARERVLREREDSVSGPAPGRILLPGDV